MGATWKAGNSKLFKHWRRIRTHLTRAYPGKSGGPARHYNDEPPLRAELFSIDQMEQHGVRLASAHRLMPGRVPDQLLSRLAANEGVLVEACDRLTAAVAAPFLNRLWSEPGAHPLAGDRGYRAALAAGALLPVAVAVFVLSSVTVIAVEV